MASLPGPQALYPYAGTSGWSGTDTSCRATVKDDLSGKTLQRHQLTLKLLFAARYRGWTVKELRDAYPDDHHGRWSAALSRAHKMGDACMLEEERVGCHVYVLLPFVRGRSTLAHRSHRLPKNVLDELRLLADADDLEGIRRFLYEGAAGPHQKRRRRLVRVPG